MGVCGAILPSCEARAGFVLPQKGLDSFAMSRLARSVLLLLVFSTVIQAQVRAQENASPLPACPAGNLLAGKMPSAWQEIERNLSLLTDETVAPEGAVWTHPWP